MTSDSQFNQPPPRVVRRECKRHGHQWKTGARPPQDGWYCARCGQPKET